MLNYGKQTKYDDQSKQRKFDHLNCVPRTSKNPLERKIKAICLKIHVEFSDKVLARSL